MHHRKVTTVKSLFLAVTLLVSLGASIGIQAQCLSAPAKNFPTGNEVIVSNVDQLQSAVENLQSNTTIRITPGQYRLNSSLYITKSNVVITGVTQDCTAVELIGPGMENANFGQVRSGVWINSNNVTIANLTIRDVYFHSIELNGGPDDIHIYNVRMLDAGEQFVKSSSAGGFGLGGDRGRVEYSIMEYLNSPPLTDHGGGTGYTNGVDVHGGDSWVIRNNVFKNFHTPDNADHLWNPAILMWNGSSNTVAENNLFINVDRAIAFGLLGRENDHRGGIIKNNMVYMSPGLFTQSRKTNSDAPIILWSSPGTKVFHNTIRTSNNTLKSIELRFNSRNVEVVNNLIDAPVVYREGRTFTGQSNVSIGRAAFDNESAGDLHLAKANAPNYRVGARLIEVATDFDGENRGPSLVYVGADSLFDATPPSSKPLGIAPLIMLLMDQECADEPCPN